MVKKSELPDETNFEALLGDALLELDRVNDALDIALMDPDEPTMTVTFNEGSQVSVTFTDWEKLNPGRIERSYNFQQTAWQTLRFQAVRKAREESFQKSLDDDGVNTKVKETVNA